MPMCSATANSGGLRGRAQIGLLYDRDLPAGVRFDRIASTVLFVQVGFANLGRC